MKQLKKKVSITLDADVKSEDLQKRMIVPFPNT